MLAEGIWDIDRPKDGAVFAAVLVIAQGPKGYLVRMNSGVAKGDNFGQGQSDQKQGDSVTTKIDAATWTFTAAELGRSLVVTRTSRLFGLLPRRQTATYRRRQSP